MRGAEPIEGRELDHRLHLTLEDHRQDEDVERRRFPEPGRDLDVVPRHVRQEELRELLEPMHTRVEWMSLESAEMSKHALNGFLAVSATYANEVARVCEQVGANAFEVERALRADSRIGPAAYVAPGGPIAGGTLARDVAFLEQLARGLDVTVPVLGAPVRSVSTWPLVFRKA